MIAPRVVVEQASEPPRKLVGRIENGNAGALQLRERSLVFAARRPEERDVLVGAVAQAHDLLDLVALASACDHERAYPGLLDHVVHDLREVLATCKAGDVRRIRRPAEVLEYGVDAVARAIAQLREVEAGLAHHV